ncbi:MAG TPA: CapA family protein [Bryobacteraceae bacterium]|nr:CapA family protein [Bryobacteraceae bacterium]
MARSLKPFSLLVGSLGFLFFPFLPAESTRPPVAPPIRLLFGGDVMLARHVYLEAKRHQDPAWPFRRIAAQFRAADIAFVNLESPFAETPPYFEDRMVFRAHPAVVEGLTSAGIDVVSTANNHARDAGARGIGFTIEHLRSNGIIPVGTTGEPAIVERKGVRFGFLAYTFDQRNGNHSTDDPRVSMLDLKTIARDVRDLRARADVAIVSMHAGYEYHTRPNRQQIRFARAAIDAGASLVVGHHPHVVQPLERYKDGVILYSLGNLVFDQRQEKGVLQQAIAEIVFSGPRMTEARLIEIAGWESK